MNQWRGLAVGGADNQLQLPAVWVGALNVVDPLGEGGVEVGSGEDLVWGGEREHQSV